MATPTINLPIKDIARQFGFIDAGIARPQRPDHFDIYLGWLLDRHAADMAYLTQERAIAARGNPCLLLPECRSILVVVARYPVPVDLEQQYILPHNGRVAAYAGGEDYHTVIIEKLEELATELAVLSHSPVSFRAFTDSGPLLERELAFNAGLGWIGRNSCLISPEYGSYTFLAELLTDLPLESQGIDD